MKEAEKDKKKCREWEQKYVDSTVAVTEMKKQVHDLEKERNYYKEMSEKYFHEVKQKEKEAMNSELDKVMENKGLEEHGTDIKQVLILLSNLLLTLGILRWSKGCRMRRIRTLSRSL